MNGTAPGREVAVRSLALLLPPVALIAAGLAILQFWLFPVIEQSGDAVLIGQNPIGFGLVFIGGVLLVIAMAYIARWRRRRAFALGSERH